MSLPESHLAQEAIAALVDGELASGPAARAARHLAGCTYCRMAVQAQREAKEALHGATDVAIPGDLLSRLRDIPFTAEVPGAGGPGALSADSGRLTLRDGSGSWSVSLEQEPAASARPGSARWLRRGLAGTLVHRVAAYALEERGLRTLVMVADPEYLAIRIYRSVGFEGTETQTQLQQKER